LTPQEVLRLKRPVRFGIFEGDEVAWVLLPDGSEFIVDAQDYPKIADYTWYRQKKGHVGAFIAREKGRQSIVYAHRLIMETPAGLETDHFNRDPLDNRRKNLRVVPRHVNARNVPLENKSASGLRGVFKTRSGKWRALANHLGERFALGIYDKKDDAAKAVLDFWQRIEEEESIEIGYPPVSSFV